VNESTVIIAPGRKTRGGITSVIKQYENSNFWHAWNCRWIETYIDRMHYLKILFFIKGFLQFLILIPSAKLIHIHFSGPTSTFRKNIFLVVAKWFNKITILHFHGFSPESTILGYRKKLYEKMLNQTDAIIALSEFWQEQLIKIVSDPEKVRVIHNPCPIIELDPNIRKKNTIIYAGTLDQRKGYTDLIHAFSKIAKRNSDWKLIFAGNGEIEKGKYLAKTLNIENQVIFVGWVSGSEKHKLFQTASIFCLPSYAEGFPMAVLDAMAYGLPIITTPVGGILDVFENEKSALIFNPGDIEELSKNLLRLIEDRKLRSILSNSSKQLAKSHFDINIIVKQIENLYMELSS